MCLYPRLIKNPKYKENKKNGGVIPAFLDERVLAVPIGCGECIECRKQNEYRDWETEEDKRQVQREETQLNQTHQKPIRWK